MKKHLFVFGLSTLFFSNFAIASSPQGAQLAANNAYHDFQVLSHENGGNQSNSAKPATVKIAHKKLAENTINHDDVKKPLPKQAVNNKNHLNEPHKNNLGKTTTHHVTAKDIKDKSISPANHKIANPIKNSKTKFPATKSIHGSASVAAASKPAVTEPDISAAIASLVPAPGIQAQPSEQTSQRMAQAVTNHPNTNTIRQENKMVIARIDSSLQVAMRQETSRVMADSQ